MIQEMRKKGIQKGLLLSCLCLAMLVMTVRPDGSGALGLGTIFLGAAAVRQWIIVFSNRFLKGIRAFCDQASSPALMMERVENIWKKGTRVGRYCRVDSEYLVWGNGLSSAVIPWKNVTRAYVFWFRGNPRLRVFFKNGTAQSVTLGQATFGSGNRESERIILEHIAKHHPKIALDENPPALELAAREPSSWSSRAIKLGGLVLVLAVLAGVFFFIEREPTTGELSEPGPEIGVVIYRAGREAVEIVADYLYGHLTEQEADDALRQLRSYFFPERGAVANATDDERLVYSYIIRIREALRNEEQDDVLALQDRLREMMARVQNG